MNLITSLLLCGVLLSWTCLNAAEATAEKSVLQCEGSALQLEMTLQKVAEKYQAITPLFRTQLDKQTRTEAADPNRAKPWIAVYYHLYRVVTLLGALANQEPDYAPAVTELQTRLEAHDKKSFNVFFRVQNGLYRAVEMSGLWAAHLGVTHEEVENVFSRMRFADKSSATAIGQSQNGAYRLEEMLVPIARVAGVPTPQIVAVNEAFTKENAACANLYDQIANGLHSSTALLQLILDAPLTPEGVEKSVRHK